MKSIAVFREPVSRWVQLETRVLYGNPCVIPSIITFRLISAWFYRGHSPNLDFFQVRPEFKDIQTGKRSRVEFAEYLEMHEYQNIQTRMLGADSFPYRNVTVTEEVLSIVISCDFSVNVRSWFRRKVFAKAVDALSHLFFVGLQEEFQLSSEALVRVMDMTDRMPLPEIKKERDHNSGKVSQDKAALKANAALMRRAREVNHFDLRLYDLGKQEIVNFFIRAFPIKLISSYCLSYLAVGKFCSTVRAYPDLVARVQAHGKVICPDAWWALILCTTLLTNSWWHNLLS